MIRLLRMFLGFLIGSGALLALLTAWAGQQPTQNMDRRWGEFSVVARAMVDDMGESPWVLWLGDSTLLPGPSNHPASYAAILARRASLGKPRAKMLAFPGLTAFEYFYVLPRLLPMRPSAVVLVANFRLFSTGGPDSTRDYFCRYLPWSWMPEAMTLPFYARGMTIPALLSCPMVGNPHIEHLVEWVDRLRESIRRASWWGQPDMDVAGINLIDRLAAQRRFLVNAYGGTITRSSPHTRMLEEVVRRIHESEIPVLVVITPIPWFRLADLGVNAQDMQSNADAIASAVRAGGGEVVDLHLALDKDGFRDEWGHFSEAGAQRMAELVGARIDAILEDEDRPVPE
jgi:hypothetical protein